MRKPPLPEFRRFDITSEYRSESRLHYRHTICTVQLFKVCIAREILVVQIHTPRYPTSQFPRKHAAPAIAHTFI